MVAREHIMEMLRGYVTLDPGLPRPNPTHAAWQEPPHQTVSNAQSASLPETVDVVIIGSGITGCSVARTLLSAEPGSALRVTVLEARGAVSGATGRNGGHLLSDSASLVPNLVSALGAEGAAQVAHFSDANILRIKELVASLSSDDREASEFRSVIGTAGFEKGGPFEAATANLSTLHAAVGSSGRATTMAVATSSEASQYMYNPAVAGVFTQLGAAALSPYRLITSIFASLLKTHEGRFTLETSTPALSIQHDSTANEAFPYTITTPRGSIRTRSIVHCTNGYASHLLPSLAGAIYPLRGTMSAQEPGPGFPRMGAEASWSYFSRRHFDLETGILCPGLYYAQQNVKSGHIFIGGESQKLPDLLNADDTVVSPEAEEHIRTILPKVFRDVEPVGHQQIWSGIMGFTSDGLPLVGRLTSDLTQREGRQEWIAAGFNGHGMDKCWLTGEALANMVLGSPDLKGLPKAFLLTAKRIHALGPDQSLASFGI